NRRASCMALLCCSLVARAVRRADPSGTVQQSVFPEREDDAAASGVRCHLRPFADTREAGGGSMAHPQSHGSGVRRTLPHYCGQRIGTSDQIEAKISPTKITSASHARSTWVRSGALGALCPMAWTCT